MNILTPYLDNLESERDYIPLVKPSITELEIKYVNDAVRNGWGSNRNNYIDLFEKNFAKKIGSKYALATSSCTGALHLGLSALGIKAGDEVIVPESTWVATLAPILHLGAKPVFVDISSDDWCIDPHLVEKAITHKTKAIVLVHLYGNVCEIERLKEISLKFNVPLIEDSAEAFGSYFKSRHVGTNGIFGVFSFHGSKTISTGEGGMFVTNNKELFENVKILNNHGVNRTLSEQYWPELPGYKYKISNIQAAMGYAQLKRSKSLINSKKEIMEFYKDFFSYNPNITFNLEKKDVTNSYWMPTALFAKNSGICIKNLINDFQYNKIDARSFFWPLSSLKFCSPVLKNKVSRDIQSRSINLPSFFEISENQLIRICSILKKHLELN